MELTTIEKIRLLYKKRGFTLEDLAQKTGQQQPNLSNKLRRGDLRESDMRAIAEALGYDLSIDFIDRETGQPI